MVFNMQKNWCPTSWQSKHAVQQPFYPDKEAFDHVQQRLTQLPPLVTSWEIETLKHKLAAAARGESFLLQGGDCAENFEECESSVIVNKLKILLKMSMILIHGSKKPVIRVGRFAGQYAKPRSEETETRDGVTLPSYRGDMINCSNFSEAKRIHDPYLLLRGYERSALTLNFIRSLVTGGFADLHHPEYWDLDFVTYSPQAREWQRKVASICESISFIEALTGRAIGEINNTDYFTSHEGLHLSYEQAQTRRVPRRTGWYNLSTHFPWIGDRTRDLAGAHIEYFRGIANPIGVKIGPTITSDELIDLVDILNPNNEPGKVTLIHRFGVHQIEKHLPPIIEEVQRAGKVVLWVCDPMHANNRKTQDGIKTRDFNDILSELEQAFKIHHRAGSYLGGVHFELTGDNITECIGGARGLTETDLNRNYNTLCEPRLNYEQSLEMAMFIARYMVGDR